MQRLLPQRSLAALDGFQRIIRGRAGDAGAGLCGEAGGGCGCGLRQRISEPLKMGYEVEAAAAL